MANLGRKPIAGSRGPEREPTPPPAQEPGTNLPSSESSLPVGHTWSDPGAGSVSVADQVGGQVPSGSVAGVPGRSFDRDELEVPAFLRRSTSGQVPPGKAPSIAETRQDNQSAVAAPGSGESSGISGYIPAGIPGFSSLPYADQDQPTAVPVLNQGYGSGFADQDPVAGPVSGGELPSPPTYGLFRRSPGQIAGEAPLAVEPSWLGFQAVSEVDESSIPTGLSDRAARLDQALEALIEAQGKRADRMAHRPGWSKFRQIVTNSVPVVAGGLSRIAARGLLPVIPVVGQINAVGVVAGSVGMNVALVLGEGPAGLYKKYLEKFDRMGGATLSLPGYIKKDGWGENWLKYAARLYSLPENLSVHAVRQILLKDIAKLENELTGQNYDSEQITSKLRAKSGKDLQRVMVSLLLSKEMLGNKMSAGYGMMLDLTRQEIVRRSDQGYPVAASRLQQLVFRLGQRPRYDEWVAKREADKYHNQLAWAKFGFVYGSIAGVAVCTLAKSSMWGVAAEGVIKGLSLVQDTEFGELGATIKKAWLVARTYGELKFRSLAGFLSSIQTRLLLPSLEFESEPSPGVEPSDQLATPQAEMVEPRPSESPTTMPTTTSMPTETKVPVAIVDQPTATSTATPTSAPKPSATFTPTKVPASPVAPTVEPTVRPSVPVTETPDKVPTRVPGSKWPTVTPKPPGHPSLLSEVVVDDQPIEEVKAGETIGHAMVKYFDRYDINQPLWGSEAVDNWITLASYGKNTDYFMTAYAYGGQSVRDIYDSLGFNSNLGLFNPGALDELYEECQSNNPVVAKKALQKLYAMYKYVPAGFKINFFGVGAIG